MNSAPCQRLILEFPTKNKRPPCRNTMLLIFFFFCVRLYAYDVVMIFFTRKIMSTFERHSFFVTIASTINIRKRFKAIYLRKRRRLTRSIPSFSAQTIFWTRSSALFSRRRCTGVHMGFAEWSWIIFDGSTSDNGREVFFLVLFVTFTL